MHIRFSLLQKYTGLRALATVLHKLIMTEKGVGYS